MGKVCSWLRGEEKYIYKIMVKELEMKKTFRRLNQTFMREQY
jgi:hypothetical protein